MLVLVTKLFLFLITFKYLILNHDAISDHKVTLSGYNISSNSRATRWLVPDFVAFRNRSTT